MTVVGLLLAAGEGRRMGQPKALLCDDRGVPFIDRTIGHLFAGGCGTVTVVLGAAADDARRILETHGWAEDEDVSIVVADDWAEGMGASLRRGLAALAALPDSDAALVMLVDLPDVREDVVRRFVALSSPTALARATYDGRPGHPVLLGREHWSAVRETATGDQGARAYLESQGAVEVPCDDLATGRDLDRPEDLGNTLGP
jgi:CTP:molybdopterin cytidylyltransferase MocA